MPSVLGSLALFAALLFAFVWKRRRDALAVSKGFPLPPGPQRKPLIGNVLDLPREKAWNTFLPWKERYGDIIYLEALGNGILVLNTLEAVNDLLDKRPNNYSDRPEFIMVGQLMELNKGIPLLQYGPTWKQHRKLTHIALSPEAVKKYYGVQEDIASMYLNGLLDEPQKFIPLLRLAAGRIVMSVTYGLPVDTPEDLYITEAEETMEMITKATLPGAFLVDLLPWLKHLPSWLPFNRIHEIGMAGRKQIYNMVNRPYEHVKQEYAAGTARPSFALDCLESLEYGNSKLPKEEADEIIRWSAGAMYGAGGETTYTTLLNFFIAMSEFPDVQAKLKEELYRVVGTGRLPTTADRPNLPYLNAAIKETLRWRVALPLSIARRTRTPDFYNGYFIPEGTIVLPNVLAMTVDTKSGIPTEAFAPERFLQGKVKEVATDPYLYAFGFGRRICPGKALGDNNLFLLMSSLMATMDISHKLDANGQKIPINPTYTSNLVSHPINFEVKIVPRCPEAAALIRERVAQIA
ncbi:cytochrome P450 [Pluteus cervinus]|uniref:Cytochrome P450 n=1 Tax=Pluteus cervinus TaxID=181527 RepID=A0ACD3AQV8_9AGAR|nr:cytochrome P450 [Pluteus cervinus]